MSVIILHPPMVSSNILFLQNTCNLFIQKKKTLNAINVTTPRHVIVISKPTSKTSITMLTESLHLNAMNATTHIKLRVDH